MIKTAINKSMFARSNSRQMGGDNSKSIRPALAIIESPIVTDKNRLIIKKVKKMKTIGGIAIKPENLKTGRTEIP